MHQEGTLFCLSAPSGGGKTSLVKALLANMDKLCVSISHTTRPKRAGEQDGKDYHFVTDTEFNDLVQQQVFLEHAIVFGHAYGTSKIWVEQQLAQGIDVILEIDWQGQVHVKHHFPDSIGIFILPPSKTSLAERLANRAQDSQQVIDKRMQAAQAEMANYHRYDYLVVNDDFDVALADLQTIIHNQRLRLKQQRLRHQELIKTLLAGYAEK